MLYLGEGSSLNRRIEEAYYIDTEDSCIFLECNSPHLATASNTPLPSSDWTSMYSAHSERNPNMKGVFLGLLW